MDDTALSGGSGSPVALRHRRPSLRHRSYSSYGKIPSTSSLLPHTPLQHNLIDSLDLRIPVTLSHVSEMHDLLDGSLLQAMRQLQTYRVELASATSDEGESDSEEEYETGYTTTGSDTGDSARVHSARARRRYARATTKDEAETLQAFLDEVYAKLASIRADIKMHLSALPSAEDIKHRFPTAFEYSNTAAALVVDPRTILDSLASQYHRANELLQHLSLYGSATLPDLPSIPSYTAARASIKEYAARRKFSISMASSYISPSITEESDESSEGCSKMKSHGDSPLPTPPLTAIRAFLSHESSLLQSKVSSAFSSDWPTQLSHAISDESHKLSTFVHDEGEKLKEFVQDEAEKLARALKHGAERYLMYHELPEKWRNNQYILSGYRFIPSDRPGELLLSGLKWHNESVNIYSHFIPAVYIIYYIFYVFPTTSLGDPTFNTLLDRSIALTFLLCSLACLLLSAAWHLAAGCGTWSIFHGCATLDYLGISSLISSSILTLTHQGFRCLPREDLVYNTSTCIFGALGLYLPWKKWFNERENKGYRVSFFLAMAGGGAAPMLHMAYLFGAKDTWNFYSPVIYSLLAYVIGLLFYVFDFPEKMRPGGLFDTLFHSHQFWHCAIVTAIALHWWALTTMSEKGLTGFSCATSDPGLVHRVTDFVLRRNEL